GKAFLIPSTGEVILLPTSRFHITTPDLFSLTAEWLFTYGIIAEAYHTTGNGSTASSMHPERVFIFIKPLRCLSLTFATLVLNYGLLDPKRDWYYADTRELVIPEEAIDFPSSSPSSAAASSQQ